MSISFLLGFLLNVCNISFLMLWTWFFTGEFVNLMFISSKYNPIYVVQSWNLTKTVTWSLPNFELYTFSRLSSYGWFQFLQVEYQLSDMSLLANETLAKHISKDPDGYGMAFGRISFTYMDSLIQVFNICFKLKFFLSLFSIPFLKFRFLFFRRPKKWSPSQPTTIS